MNIKNFFKVNRESFTRHNFVKLFSVSLLFTFFFLSCNFIFLEKSFAQASLELNITLNPNNPKVGDTVTATVESYSIDVDKADMSWILDKKVVKNGFGEKEYTFVMNKDYQTLLIKAVTPEGKIYAGGVSLLEKSVSIIWEGGDSYIPDWYKGKRYVSSGGNVRVMAIANISDGNNYIDNKDLVFTWEVNGAIDQKASGLGKYYTDLNIIDEYGDSVEIAVTVKPRLTSDSIKEYIKINTVPANVLLYEKDPVYGVIKRLLGSEIKVNKKEIEIVAEPFFYSVDSFKLNNMKYVWSINGKQQQGNNFSRVFKLGEKSGYAVMGIYVEHIKKLMQDSKREIKINF